jgi:hypothetical protein
LTKLSNYGRDEKGNPAFAANVFIMELTDRELALRWWNRKSTQEKTELAKKATFPERDFSTLTGREIEWIWRNQPHNR